MIDRRAVLAAGAWSLAAMASPRAEFDAVVLKPGAAGPAGRRFATLGAALAAADGRPFRIWLGAGEWREKLAVTTANVSILGEHRARTVLVFDAASGAPAPDGTPWGTFRTATLSVLAAGFTARRLTVANDFAPPPGPDRDGPFGGQAVALMLAQGSDRAVLRDVDLLGHQDTLFADAGRTMLDRCLVTGTVDFIFGAGAVLLRGCEVRSRARTADPVSAGYVAAPSTDAGQAVGLVFDRCRLTREAGVADGAVFLGRPWRPTRDFAGARYGDPHAVGMAAFLDCRMEAHIAAAGWTAMGYNGADGTRRQLEPEAVRFGERGSVGPGARGIRRGMPIEAAEAARLRRAFDDIAGA